MREDEGRAHGVTPGLRRDYGARTAGRQAAFVLPHLTPGMDLLDAGCGPGSITLGLARAVSPGRVTGIDHDPVHVQEAKTLAAAQRTDNVTFREADVLSLPFEDSTFDAAFENNLFVHVAPQAARAAAEVFRVLKPGGLFAARDADAGAVLWGRRADWMEELDRLFRAWHRSRGSDISLGRRLPAILREAGFTATVKSVSADTKGDPEAVRSHAETTIFLLDGPFGDDVVARGWADRSLIGLLKQGVRAWGEHPDSFFANVHIEVIGWKPGR